MGTSDSRFFSTRPGPGLAGDNAGEEKSSPGPAARAVAQLGGSTRGSGGPAFETSPAQGGNEVTEGIASFPWDFQIRLHPHPSDLC